MGALVWPDDMVPNTSVSQPPSPPVLHSYKWPLDQRTQVKGSFPLPVSTQVELPVLSALYLLSTYSVHVHLYSSYCIPSGLDFMS